MVVYYEHLKGQGEAMRCSSSSLRWTGRGTGPRSLSLLEGIGGSRGKADLAAPLVAYRYVGSAVGDRAPRSSCVSLMLKRVLSQVKG